ncbi:MAG: reverse transcriptase-like protein [Ornithinibacter sp.]
MSRRLTIEADGGSRGNPGVGGYGALVRDADTGALLAERAAPLGKVSNNVAEYRGLIAGLESAARIDSGADVLARMDSKLVVEQMSGRWKIKHEDMRRLALEAREVAAEFIRAGGSVRYEWIPREKNKDADALSNDGMDGLTIDRMLGADAGADEEPAPGEREPTASACDPVAAAPGIPVRVVLVAQAAGSGARAAASAALTHLLGSAPRCLVTASSDAAVETAAEVASALGAEAVVDADWSGTADRVLAAWDRVMTRGGTTVVVCPDDAVRMVLGHLLGAPADRRRRVAVSAGSLTGVEVWDDGEVSIAFTNRT